MLGFDFSCRFVFRLQIDEAGRSATCGYAKKRCGSAIKHGFNTVNHYYPPYKSFRNCHSFVFKQ
jgi:hypothetical protein